MPHAINIHRPGGPEVLTYEPVDLPPPGRGEVRIRHLAIGVNFIDTYYRTALYPWPTGAPLIIGAEGAGEVEEVGEGVSQVRPGDRITYTVPRYGLPDLD